MARALMMISLAGVCVIVGVLTASGQIGWFDAVTTLIPCGLVVVALGLKGRGRPKV